MLKMALERLGSASVHSFVAPILDTSRHKIVVVQAGVPFHFRIHAEVGWRSFDVMENRAFDVGEADMPFIFRYLSVLPSIKVVSVANIAEQAWVCIPFNPHDAGQKGWKESAPRVVQLCRHSLQVGDVVEARFLGSHLIYDDLVLRNLQVGQQTRNVAYGLAEEINRSPKVKGTEDMLRESVEFMGADLVGWDHMGDVINVRWTWNGYTNVTTINLNLEVDTVGFCAAGTDAMHNLTTAVALLQEGVRRNHYAVQYRRDE